MTGNRPPLIITHLVFGATLSLALLPAMSFASDQTLPYSSRGGLDVTVTSRSGIGTAKAIITIEHTRKNARDYCEGFEIKPLKACIDQTMSDIKVQKSVTANCTTGRFTDVWGGAFAFNGRAKKGDTDYTIVDIATGLPINGSTASDYGPRLTTFEALCPNSLR